MGWNVIAEGTLSPKVNGNPDLYSDQQELTPQQLSNLSPTGGTIHPFERFPYAIFYLMEEKKQVVIFGVLLTSRDPEIIRKRRKKYILKSKITDLWNQSRGNFVYTLDLKSNEPASTQSYVFIMVCYRRIRLHPA